MENVFISYANRDSEKFVSDLRDALERSGRPIRAHVLAPDRKPGAEAFTAINDILAQSSVAIVVIGPSYFESTWCEDELKAIWALRHGHKIRLIVIHHGVSARDVIERRPLLAAVQPFVNGLQSMEALIDEIVQGMLTTKKERHRERLESVPVVLAGCGEWALHRTVVPLLKYGHDTGERLFHVVAVTNLLGGADEFRDVNGVLRDVGEGNVRYYSYLKKALREHHERPLAVIVNLPNRYHDEVAMNALDEGCDVYAERPINQHTDSLPDLIGAAALRARYLYSGTQRRCEYPFVYMAKVLRNNKLFGELRTIRCSLASGRRGGGRGNWRRKVELAGGGIVMDEGYHLLDIAIWLGQIKEAKLKALSRSDVKGAVEFRYNEMVGTDSSPGDWNGIETSAYGSVMLPGNIKLIFDLSYAAPKDSIFECIEFRDANNARLRLMRDKPKRHPQRGRRPEPGQILYQSGDGGDARQGFVSPQLELSPTASDDFAADDSRPLRQFLRKVQSTTFELDEVFTPGVNDCDARFLLSTQELLIGLYELGAASRSPES